MAQTPTPYKPKYLTDDQLRREGGEDSKTGAFRVSPAGAVGPAQVMPQTGPEAAELAGIPWDENRYRTDRNYNLQLGDAYQGMLLKKYGGDRVKAEAAYNAGPGRVDAAIRKGGDNWQKHIPAETRKYVSKLTGRGGGITGTNPMAGGVSGVDNGESTARAKLTGGQSVNSNPVLDVFKAGGELAARAGKADSAIQDQGNLIEENAAKVEQIQDQRRGRMEAEVAAKGSVLDDVIAGNRKLMNNVNPLLQQKQKVDERLGELATMNPLVRGIKGIFDLNYNQNYLGKVSGELDAGVKAQAQNFDYITSIQDSYLKHIEAKSASQGSMEELSLKEMDEDANILAQKAAFGTNSLNSLGNAINQQENLVRAQALSRGNTLDQMTPGDINSAMVKAQKDPTGTITVNGSVIGYEELRQRAVAHQTQEMQIQSAQLAMQAQNQNLLEHHADQLAGTMTRSQLETAAANGGVYQGVQLSNTQIAQNLQIWDARDSQKIDQAMGAAEIKNPMIVTRQMEQQVRGFAKRALPMGGGALAAPIAGILGEATALTNQYQELIKSGAGAKAAGPVTQQMLAIQKKMDTLIGGAATKLSGGDKQTADVLKNYWMGTPIDSATATNMMLKFAKKGGLPLAMRASPTFSGAFKATQEAAAAVDREYRAAGLDPSKSKQVPTAERDGKIADKIAQIGPRVVNQQNYNAFMVKLPDIARAAGDPFGRVSTRDWQMAKTRAQADAVTWAASQVGVTQDELTAFYRSGTIPAKQAKNVEVFKKLAAEIKPAMSARERAQTLVELDQTPAATSGFTPSKAFVDFLESDKFYKQAQEFEQFQSEFSFGDYTAGAMRGEGMTPIVHGYATQMGELQRLNQTNRFTATREARNKYTNFPVVRTGAIIGGIEGLNQHDEAQLGKIIASQFPDLTNTDKQINGPPNMAQVNSQIRDFVMSAKLQDPNADRILKIARKEWDKVGGTLDRAYDRMDEKANPVTGFTNWLATGHTDPTGNE